METPEGVGVPRWVAESDRLRKWFYAYLGLSITGVVLSSGLGGWLIDLGMVAYVISVVYAYRVQRHLRATGLTRTGPWVVVGATLTLGYFFGRFEWPLTRGQFLLIIMGGIIVPAAVLWEVRRAKRDILP